MSNLDELTPAQQLEYYVNHPTELFDPITLTFNRDRLEAIHQVYDDYIADRAREYAERNNPKQYAASQRILGLLLRHGRDGPLSQQEQEEFDHDRTLLSLEQTRRLGLTHEIAQFDDPDMTSDDLNLFVNGIRRDDDYSRVGYTSDCASQILTAVLDDPIIYWTQAIVPLDVATAFHSLTKKDLRRIPGLDREALLGMSKKDLMNYYYEILINNYRQNKANLFNQLRRDMEVGIQSKPLEEYVRYLDNGDVIPLLNEFSIEWKDEEPWRLITSYFDYLQHNPRPALPRTNRKLL